MKTPEEIKKFYSSYSDKIISKRFRSEHPIRKYVHMQQYLGMLNYIRPGMSILDAGCGEGVLSVLMAKKGARVTGCDISDPNIQRCKEYANEEGVADNTNFLVADLEGLPFSDNKFDLVVSSHVLEHLPDFDKGLSEVMRVTKKRSIIAIPTVLNLCSIVQVGGGDYWSKRKKSFLALPWGLCRLLFAAITLKEGVDESYAGEKVPHVYRFPWIMKNKAKKLKYRVTDYEAATLSLPMFEFLLPFSKFLDRFKKARFFRNFGCGTIYVVEK